MNTQLRAGVLPAQCVSPAASDEGAAARPVYASARTGDAALSNIDRCLLHPLNAVSSGACVETWPMTAYQGFRIFSHVVLVLMSAGIVYAAYIAVTYWTGISV